MLSEKYENQAQQIQDEINRLEAVRTETRRTLVSAENDIEEVKSASWLRDRHTILLWLGGDRQICEQARSLRRETRRSGRRLRREDLRSVAKQKEIEELIHNGLKRCDPAYQAVLARLDKGKKASDSCAWMLKLVGAARSRVDEAVASARPHFRDEASRSAADVDASEVSNRIQAVRHHATGLNRKVRHHGTLSPADIKNLNVTLPGSDADYQVRVRAYRAVGIALDSIDRRVEDLLDATAKQAKTDEDERIRLLHQERARFK